MRFTLTFVAAVGAFSAATASMVARQSLPSCAVTCLANGDFGSCSQQDNACLCKSQAFVNSTTVCIEKDCQGDDLKNAEAYSQAICEAVGVTLTSAGTAAAATATTPSSTSAAAAAAATTGAALSTKANALTGAAAVGLGILALVL